MSDLKLELCAALIPKDSHYLECLSSDMMRTNKNCYIRLGNNSDRLSISAHLTLYQFAIYVNQLDDVNSEMEAISKVFSSIKLIPNCFNYNDQEGSFEIIYNKTDEISQLQTMLVTDLNKLRRDLLVEKEPSGIAPNVQDINIKTYGFKEVNDSFKPHVTLNWFDTDELQTVPKSQAPLHDFCIFDSLGLFILGPRGTCVQKLFSFKLH